MTSGGHTHDGTEPYSHGDVDAAAHGHSHEILDGPGSYLAREMPLAEGRDWTDRAFTIGIGGYAQALPLQDIIELAGRLGQAL